jgi:hypothetical protein
MATDYDTPRKTDEELHEESLEELKAKRADAQSGQIDIDEEEAAENLELPGADLSGEELAVRVVPLQENEFTCSRCFLVHHASQLAKGEGAKAVCKDCA